VAIRKTKAGTFECDIRDQHGKKRLKTFQTKHEARDYEKQALAQVSSGEYSPVSKKTVGEIAREWYEGKAAQVYRRASLIQWRNHVDNYIVESLGNVRVSDLDVQAVESAAGEWAKKVSPITSNMVLTTLTAVLDMAERHNHVKRNVAEKAMRVKVATESEKNEEIEPDKVYTKAELSKLIQASEGVTKLFVMAMAFTGLRIGEVLGLAWPNVDLKTAKLHVRLSMADSDEGVEAPLFQPPKTKSSKRTLSLPHELVKALRVWQLACPITERGLVFATEEGKPYQRYKVIKLLDEAITKAKIKRLTPHGLRHTFASLLLADGKPVTEVSHLLGHKNAHVTMTVYAHFIREESTATQELASSVLGQ
jgi:integrase